MHQLLPTEVSIQRFYASFFSPIFNFHIIILRLIILQCIIIFFFSFLRNRLLSLQNNNFPLGLLQLFYHSCQLQSPCVELSSLLIFYHPQHVMLTLLHPPPRHRPCEVVTFKDSFIFTYIIWTYNPSLVRSISSTTIGSNALPKSSILIFGYIERGLSYLISFAPTDSLIPFCLSFLQPCQESFCACHERF